MVYGLVYNGFPTFLTYWSSSEILYIRTYSVCMLSEIISVHHERWQENSFSLSLSAVSKTLHFLSAVLWPSWILYCQLSYYWVWFTLSELGCCVRNLECQCLQSVFSTFCIRSCSDIWYGECGGRHLGSRAEVVVMKNCGHVPQAENPKEYNHIVLDFLKSSVAPVVKKGQVTPVN